MDNYRKKFSEWAKVQNDVEKRDAPTLWKVGGVFWMNQGINIGSEQDGKGPRFTRPVLIISQFSERLVLVAPVSSKIRRHRYRFKIILGGEIRTVLLDQI